MKKKNIKLNVIIQAGGKGTRLKHNTWNRPKCLVPVLGKTLLYHTLDAVDANSFYLIGDYKFDALKLYTETIKPKNNLHLIKAKGSGSLSGINQTLHLIKNDGPILIIWSDLFFTSKLKLQKSNKPLVGISDNFPCRYLIQNKKIKKNINLQNKNGVIGFFYFPNKELLKNISSDGEFVEYLINKKIKFNTQKFDNVSEIGEDGNLEIFRSKFSNSRYFNEISKFKKYVIKKSKIKDFDELLKGEKAWYKNLNKYNFNKIPKIYKSKNSIKLERIHGKHPYQIFSNREKILKKIFLTIDDLHSISEKEATRQDLNKVYYKKTIDRVLSIKNMIPNFKDEEFRINGQNCKNYFSKKYIGDLKKLLKIINPNKFKIIHGDTTFSNILIDKKNNVKLIDPRMNFGNSKLFGDPLYDWAKLYYSVYGSYDNFNNKKFALRIINKNIEYYILENGWAKYQYFFKEKFGKEINKIDLIHGLIWLSLTGYVKEDYDSILTSFYKGLFIINELEKNFF